jgi:molecular chaperone DnaK
MTSDEIILGIDLGTTFSVAAYVDEQGRPRVIPNAEGRKTTPSVVMIDGGCVEVGEVALNQAIAKRDKVVQWIKRAMGDAEYRFNGLTPAEISAAILKKLKADCEVALGAPLRKAVITCPAYFSAVEVENTMRAGTLAGFEVQEIVREPTAAAVYYGVEHLREGDHLLVCDLGGGTYDASILTLEKGAFRPLATAGDRQLGGHDWTTDLLDHVVERLSEMLGADPRSDAAVEQSLYDACERLKRDFSQADHGVIPCVFGGRAVQVAVSRADFEQLTEWRIQQMVTWTEKALAKADPPLGWDRIDHVLLVGGSTRLRRVSEALAARSGKKPIQTAEVDTMVALGAAVLSKGAYRPRRPAASGAKVVSGLTLVNFVRTAPRNLGTRVIVREGADWRIQNSTLIRHGTQIPTEATRTDFHIGSNGHSFFDIPVVEFDDVGADVIQDTWRFTRPAGIPSGTGVHVTFRYDQSGCIDVEAVEQHGRTALAKVRVQYEEPDVASLEGRPPPRVVLFAIDVSGSMTEKGKIDHAREGVLSNARELLKTPGGSVQVGIVTFGSRAEVLCRPSTDFAEVQGAVAKLTISGSTAMAEGLALALSLIAEAPAHVSRTIVLVSDGMPDEPEEALAAAARARTQGVRLCQIGVGREGVDESFLRKLSGDYRVIDNAGEVGGAIASLLTQVAPAPPAGSGITWL